MLSRSALSPRCHVGCSTCGGSPLGVVRVAERFCLALTGANPELQQHYCGCAKGQPIVAFLIGRETWLCDTYTHAARNMNAADIDAARGFCDRMVGQTVGSDSSWPGNMFHCVR